MGLLSIYDYSLHKGSIKFSKYQPWNTSSQKAFILSGLTLVKYVISNYVRVSGPIIFGINQQFYLCLRAVIPVTKYLSQPFKLFVLPQRLFVFENAKGGGSTHFTYDVLLSYLVHISENGSQNTLKSIKRPLK